MNVRMAPKHFVSDGTVAFFVEGFTSDDMREWRLRSAQLGTGNKPDMSTVEDYFAIDDESVLVMTKMIGNVQRMCQGIPTVRRGY